MSNNFSYQKAKEELEKILTAIESEKIGIDELSDKVKRAKELIRLSKEKLRNTEEEINDLLD